MLKMRLKEVLVEKGMTQKELAEKCGLQPTVISEMARNARESINRNNAGIVIKALGITDLNKLFYVE